MKAKFTAQLFMRHVCAPTVPAQELIVNGSFETTGGNFIPDDNNLMSLPAGSAVIPGWTVTNAELIWGGNIAPFGPATPYGTLFLDLTGYHDFRPTPGSNKPSPLRTVPPIVSPSAWTRN